MVGRGWGLREGSWSTGADSAPVPSSTGAPATLSQVRRNHAQAFHCFFFWLCHTVRFLFLFHVSNMQLWSPLCPKVLHAKSAVDPEAEGDVPRPSIATFCVRQRQIGGLVNLTCVLRNQMALPPGNPGLLNSSHTMTCCTPFLGRKGRGVEVQQGFLLENKYFFRLRRDKKIPRWRYEGGGGTAGGGGMVGC